MIPFTLESPGSFAGHVRGLIQHSEKPGPRPTVVICHGFKGFMEWGFFPPLAELLAARGLTVIRFNFSGSGMAPGDELVGDLDAFKRNTFSLERDETLRVLNAAEALAPGRVDPDRLAVIGHSRGGGAALLASAAEGRADRLRAVVTWSAVATFDRYGLDVRDVWRRDGAIPLRNGRTGQELELGVELLDDVEQNREALDLEAAASRRKAPWLIVHGDADETVPVAEAERLHAHATGETALELVEGGSHTFGAKHPFVGPTRELIHAMNATQRWLRRHLA
ncbi:MAG: alpha/beta hydrolase [Acidobacteriota bacterium]